MKKNDSLKKTDLISEIARLESLNDHLMTELTEMDFLMRQIGFSNGLQTVKLTALELYHQQNDEENPDSKPEFF